MSENNDMSEEDDSKLNKDKEASDDSDSMSNPYKEKHSSDKKTSKSPPGAPRITPRKHLDLFGKLCLKGKHDRSFDSSYSSDSFEMNKKKKKELTAFQKNYVKNQKESFDNNYNNLKEDFKLLEEYESKIFKDTNLDLMFIMDLTGSMGIWLNEAKKSIKNIIEEITDNNPGSKIRISFIGYRDFLSKDEQRLYDIQDFTEDIEIFNDFISKLDCNGGGDEPEDIVGALRQALKMSWMSNAKYAVLVGDAPCHGKKYHNISYDKFGDGDPDGVLLEDVMKQFHDKDITFYCIEINSSTKKMFNIMENIYNDNNKFHIEKLGNSVHQFSFFVSFSVSVLLGNTKYNKIKVSDLLANCRKETIEKIMKKYLNKNDINNDMIMNKNGDSITSQLISEIENLNIGNEDKKLFDFINRMNELDINKENSANNTYDDNSFVTNLVENDIKSIETKEINYILRALSYDRNENTVNDWINPTIQEKIFKTKLKITFNTFKNNANKNEYEIYFFDEILDKEKKGIIPYKINRNLYNSPSEYIKTIAFDELICEQMADYFNILLDQELVHVKQFIKFQRHILYELDPDAIMSGSISLNDYCLKNKYIISEYSNSIQLVTSIPASNRIIQCFSHFSYQISGGNLLIADINYDKDLKKVTEFKKYSIKENGYKKILEFFTSHICDNTCKALGLVHPRKKLNPIQVQENFFSNKYLIDTKLCKCCSAPFHQKEGNEINNNKESLNCGFCSWKESRSKHSAVCSACNNIFFYSSYVYNYQLQNYPTKRERCNSLF